RSAGACTRSRPGGPPPLEVGEAMIVGGSHHQFIACQLSRKTGHELSLGVYQRKGFNRRCVFRPKPLWHGLEGRWGEKR
ncbi:MAG: hypothetical protein AABZ12_06900, partial [Planctomycetota bacterium]